MSQPARWAPLKCSSRLLIEALSRLLRREAYHSIAEPGEQPRCDELPQTERRTLYRSADYHYTASSKYRLLPTQHITQPDGCDRAEKAAQSISSDSDTYTSQPTLSLSRYKSHDEGVLNGQRSDTSHVQYMPCTLEAF